MKNDNIPVIIFEPEKLVSDGEIGFRYIADMIRERSRVEGYFLNLLVVGRRGIGTSTLMNCIFNCGVVEAERDDDINTTMNTITENDLNLNLTITTYHQENADDIVKFIEDHFYSYFVNEFHRSQSALDTRIHACLWLIPSDTIKPSEIEMIKRISEIINVIPIIPKSDSFTEPELYNYKSKILELLAKNEINVFYPSMIKDDDDEYNNEINSIIKSYPLAVFASTEDFDFAGIRKRGRSYPWGFIDCEDESLCDLVKLRKLIIQNHLEDLIYHTDTHFYNEYRKKILLKEGGDESLKKERLRKLIDEMTRIHEEKHSARSKALNQDISELEELYKTQLKSSTKKKQIHKFKSHEK